MVDTSLTDVKPRLTRRENLLDRVFGLNVFVVFVLLQVVQDLGAGIETREAKHLVDLPVGHGGCGEGLSSLVLPEVLDSLVVHQPFAVVYAEIVGAVPPEHEAAVERVAVVVVVLIHFLRGAYSGLVRGVPWSGSFRAGRR